jgi:hypothetical protein
VGGIAGLAVLGALAFFLLRRRSRRTSAAAPLDPKDPTHELPGSGEVLELPSGPGHTPVHELPT